MTSGSADSNPQIAAAEDALKHLAPRIAVVEDEPLISSIFSAILNRAGYNVVKTCNNGKEFLDYLDELVHDQDESLLPDIVVMDFRMPRLDGLETAKLLRAAHPKMKIIMTTAYELPNESAEYFDAYVRKPVSKEALLNAVSQETDK